MTQFSDDDRKLVAFLKQYHPVPPPASRRLEEHIMERVNREPILGQQRSNSFFWIVPSAMLVSVLMVLGGYRWLNSSEAIAVHPEELETFLIESWTGAMGEAPYSSQDQNISQDWLLLSNPEAAYVVSSP